MMQRYILRDDQWERIKDLLPGKSTDCGVTAGNNRLFIEAVCGLHEQVLRGVIYLIHLVTGIAFMYVIIAGQRKATGRAFLRRFLAMRI